MKITFHVNTPGDLDTFKSLFGSGPIPHPGTQIANASSDEAAEREPITVWTSGPAAAAEALKHMAMADPSQAVEHASTAPDPEPEKPKAKRRGRPRKKKEEEPKPEAPVDPKPEATVEVPTNDPVEAPPAVDPNEGGATRAKLRQLLLDAGSLPGVTFDDVKETLRAAVGGVDIKVLDDGQIEKATQAIEDFMVEVKLETPDAPADEAPIDVPL